jgi:hypothetical protein
MATVRNFEVMSDIFEIKCIASLINVQWDLPIKEVHRNETSLRWRKFRFNTGSLGLGN